MTAPFVPNIQNDNFDQNHVNNTEWKDAEVVKENALLLRRDSIQELFKGYYFSKNEMVTASTKATTGGNQANNEENNDAVEMDQQAAQ